MKEYRDILCPVCGCLCDDIEVNVENNSIVKVQNACAMGASKFLNFSKERLKNPLMRKNGELVPCSLNEAIDHISRALVKAEFPVIYGFALSSCEAIKVGIELAEEIGAVIDNQTTVCHGPGVQGLQDIGQVSCTLGEVKHRADLIIYWGSNPQDAHPRHFERYSLLPEGRFRGGKKDRKLVVVDVRKTATARMADFYIRIEQGKDFELISALRALLRFEDIEQEQVAGIPKEKVEELAEMMRSCEYGVIFFGQGLTQTIGKDRNGDNLFALVRDLNKFTKFLVMPIRGHYNVTGSNEVLTWQTGFPFGVDLSKGYPWYNPGDTTVVDIFRRGENDLTLVVGSDPLAHLPRRATMHILEHPLFTIDPSMSLTAMASNVVIPSAFYGLEAEGTAYRMDGVALPLKKIVEPPEGILPDEEILRRILEKVKEIRGK
ncbi:MAG: formylmethanofuran dehydrogenase subunit B [Nitrososphaerales archaeon]